jgi:hypothetical protein
MTARKAGAPPSNAQEKPRSEAAQQRLAAALRENLARRKAQARAREAPPEVPPKGEAR